MNIAKIVREAREQTRLTALDFATGIFDDFVELHGDRSFRDDGAIIGGIGWLGDQAVTVVGIQKGKSLQDNLNRNFGQPHPEGYRKALRLMKQAEKFNRPVVTFINTAGAFCGATAEERGIGEAIADNLRIMSHLKVPIIAILCGEGGSGGALGLAVANEVWMMEYAMYSILSPEGFASILWKDGSKAAQAAELMKFTCHDLLDQKIVDRVIFEKKKTNEQIASELREKLKVQLDFWMKKSKEEIVSRRLERFNQY